MHFLTVDRRRTMNQGQVISLVKHADISPPELQLHVNCLFPEGLSRHGERYFISSQTQAQETNPSIELLLEYVRRARFPNRPSRFQSLFGIMTMEDALWFASAYGCDDSLIWEVECETFFRADMSLLTQNCTNLVYSYYAELYWSGRTVTANPRWESLLVPPIAVTRLIGEYKTLLGQNSHCA